MSNNEITITQEERILRAKNEFKELCDAIPKSETDLAEVEKKITELSERPFYKKIFNNKTKETCSIMIMQNKVTFTVIKCVRMVVGVLSIDIKSLQDISKIVKDNQEKAKAETGTNNEIFDMLSEYIEDALNKIEQSKEDSKKIEKALDDLDKKIYFEHKRLEEKVDEFEEDIAENREDIAENREDIDDLQENDKKQDEDIDDLQENDKKQDEDIDDLQENDKKQDEDIDDLQEKVKDLIEHLEKELADVKFADEKLRSKVKISTIIAGLSLATAILSIILPFIN